VVPDADVAVPVAVVAPTRYRAQNKPESLASEEASLFLRVSAHLHSSSSERISIAPFVYRAISMLK
jgi:hypothetical protein